MRRALHATTMLRFMRPQRSIFSMSRLPMKVEAQVQRGQAPSIQKVRFGKPKPRLRNFAISFVVFSGCIWLYDALVLDPLAMAAKDALENMPDIELDEDASKPLFIPFPGTTKQLLRQPYRGSDPEWQEFIRFSKDQALIKKVREELAQHILTSADTHPVLTMRTGKGMKLRRYWLDVDFPQAPPPEFVRSGIEITDDHIAWAQAPVDSLLMFKVRQALWPTSLFKSFWSFTRVMIVDDAKRLAGMLGISTTPPPSIEQIFGQRQQLIKNPTPNKDGPQLPPVSDPSKAIVKTPAAGPDKSTTTAATAAGAAAGSENGEMQQPTAATHSIARIHAHFLRPMMAFKTKFVQTWKPAATYPPRGSIVISGCVELDAPKAFLVFDVKAAWDPKAKEYHARSMNIQLRRVQLKKQGPTGGP